MVAYKKYKIVVLSYRVQQHTVVLLTYRIMCIKTIFKIETKCR